MQLSAFPFSTILFDLDGTLVDSAPDVLEAIAAVLRDAGDPVPQMALSIIGPPLEGIFREVCPDADEAKIARHVAAFRDLYFGGTFPKSTPYPGIFALLERLRAKGCRLFVATHKPEAAAQRMLTLKGFMPFLEGVGCTDSLPDRQLCKKDIIRLLMERHALDPASMVMVGDTALDIRGGNEQGIATIAALYGYGDKAKLLAERPRYLNGARSARRSSPYKIKKPSFFRSEKGRLFVVTMYDPALFQRASVLEEERDFPCKDMIPGATTGPTASSATDATPPHGTLHVGEARQANTSNRGGRAPRGTDRRTRPGGAYPERRGSQARHTRPAALW